MLGIMVDGVEVARGIEYTSADFNTISIFAQNTLTAGQHIIKGAFATDSAIATTEIAARGFVVLTLGLV